MNTISHFFCFVFYKRAKMWKCCPLVATKGNAFALSCDCIEIPSYPSILIQHFVDTVLVDAPLNPSHVHLIVRKVVVELQALVLVLQLVGHLGV